MHNKNLRISMTSLILSVFVICIHSYNIHLYPEFVDTWVFEVEEFVSNVIGWLAIPLFFLISGFLFFNNFDLKQLFNKISRRMKSLMLPYIIWNIIYMCFFYVVTNTPVLSNYFSTDPLILNISSIIKGIFLYKYNVFYWYMYQLIIYILISPFIYHLLKRFKVGAIAIIILFVISNCVGEIPDGSEYGLKTGYFLFYMIGGFIGFHFNRFMYEKPRIPLKITILVFSVLLFLRTTLMTFKGHIYSVLNSIVLIVTVLVLYVLLGYVECRYNHTIFRLNLIIYTIHPLIVDSVMKVYAEFLPHTETNVIFNYIVSILIGFTGSCAVGLLMKKYCNKELFCILNGGR